MRPFLLLCLPVVLAPVALAQFAQHTVPPNTASGTPQVVSGNIRHDLGVDALASAVSSSANYSNRFGYVGQLTDVTALALSAPATAGEGELFPVSALATLDDGTRVVPDSSSVAWSVVSGPVYFDDNEGTAVALWVYQNTAGTVRGAYRGHTADLTVTVFNLTNDDYGTYARDGLPDSWQVAHFGEANALAAPAADPDGDGQNNLLEYLAGTDPLLGTSLFTVRIANVTGQPSQKLITFGPLAAGRFYRIFATADLAAGPWTDISGTLIGASGEYTFPDTNAGGVRKFYRVQISSP